VVCRASLLPVDRTADGGNPLTFILGEPVLRKYYTSFDWKKHEIGFALARQPVAGKDEAGVSSSAKLEHAVLGAPPQTPQIPVLVQV